MQNKQTNTREAHRPALSSPSDVITMLNGLKTKQNKTKKHENKKQSKTQHETLVGPREGLLTDLCIKTANI